MPSYLMSEAEKSCRESVNKTTWWTWNLSAGLWRRGIYTELLTNTYSCGNVHNIIWKNLWAAPATLTPWSFSFHYWCQLLVLNLPIHNIESCSIVRQETIILLSNDGTRLGLIANINIRFKLSLLYSGDAIVIESGDKSCRKYSICIIKSLLDSNDSAS